MKSYKLSTLEKVGFGAGDMAVNVVISSMMLIITYFYTDIFGLKPTDLAILFLAVRFIDAFTDPLMGMITDKYTTRWGRYRPYFLFLSIPFGISVFLTFSTPDFDYNQKLVWAYATYIFVTIMFTSVTIPYISLIGVLTNDPKERLSANGYRLFFAKIAAFLVTTIVPILAKHEYWQGNQQLGYQMAMGLMAIMGVGLFLFCFFTTKERIVHVADTKPFKQQLKLLLKNDQWLILCSACFLITIGYVVRGSIAIYYAKYYLGGDEKFQSLFLSAGVAAAILAMVASTWTTKSYCKIKLFKYSQMWVGALSLLMFFAVEPGDMLLALVIYFVLSFVVDLHAPVFWSTIAEAVDYGEVKNKERVSGLAYGGISFFQKAGMGLAGAIVSWLLAYFDYVPNQEQTEHALFGIALILCVIPGAFHFLVGVLMTKYFITDEYYKQIEPQVASSHTGVPVEQEAAEMAEPPVTQVAKQD
ncbi:MFS transporter [Catenovulum sp. 2E275]|uniref:MFS transporter n=1 Tax=Catenovulum sp. 2E275 TaxID=2980497 RepID=UPI0021CFB1C7|nr:MFS transporter [Catenovulum sp. 2E275]MCU4676457.1 MFS transporter [Catenovulum sp. 2E275]